MTPTSFSQNFASLAQWSLPSHAEHYVFFLLTHASFIWSFPSFSSNTFSMKCYHELCSKRTDTFCKTFSFILNPHKVSFIGVFEGLTFFLLWTRKLFGVVQKCFTFIVVLVRTTNQVSEQLFSKSTWNAIV